MPESTSAQPRFFGDGPLVLCLSGGGFRATFFHLGVIRLLAAVGCLTRITHVFSVSGGSIIGAHMGLNWSAYTSGKESQFRDMSDALVRFAQHDLRGRIVRRWLLGRSRAGSLQREYDAFFSSARLENLPREPRFHFLATSMRTGRLCAFTREGFVVAPEAGGLITVPAEAQPIAQAVAASSAFPPLFPPVELRLPDIPLNTFQGEFLTDGGVFDNLGLSRLDRFLGKTPSPAPHIIVSDASALFDEAPDSRFTWLPSRASRATDILMQRVASLEAERTPSWADHLTVLRITDAVNDMAFDTMWFRAQTLKAQRLLKSVRTDFDAFPSPLIRSLVQHGYEVAFRAAMTSALSADDVRAAEGREPDERRQDEATPWDPMPPGWPDRKAILDYENRAAMLKPLQELDRLIKKASEITGTQPTAEIRQARDEEKIRRRNAAVELEAFLQTSSDRPLALWNRRDWAAWFLACVGIGFLALVGWGGVWALRHFMPAPAVVPHGALRIVEGVPYAGEGWVKRFPSLSPLLGADGYVYTIETATLGDLTDHRPHAPAFASVKLAGLQRARLFLFLESADAVPQVTLLEQATTARLVVPSGQPGDRFRGILITPDEIPDLQKRLNKDLVIALETTP